MGKRLLASMLAVCVAVVLLPGMVLAGTDDGGSTVPSTTASISTTPSAPGDGSADGSLDGDGTPGENAGETTTTTTTTPAATEPSAAQAIQSRIDALPEADSLSGMDAEQLAQLQKEVSEIYAALDGLAEGKDTLDTAKLDAVSAYFSTAANSSTVKADGIDTIDKLKAALEAGGTVELTDDITYDTRVDITITQPVTLDLKGHTVEETYGGINHFLMTIKGGSLTLTDSVGGGALIASHASYGYGIQMYSNSTFIMNGGTIRTSQETVDLYNSVSNVKVEINGGSLISTADSTMGIRGSQNVDVDINGGTMESSGRVGFYISSYQKDAIDLDITGGSIVSNGRSALQIYSGANVTVSGNASISAPSSTAIQVQGGVTGSESTLTVNGGTITGSGYGVTVDDAAKLTVNDGSITAKTGSAVCAYENATVDVTGGKLTGATGKDAIKAGSGDSPSITVTGGTFSSNVDAYIPDGLGIQQNPDGSFTVTRLDVVYLGGAGASDTNTGADAANPVKTLDKALSILAEGGTVVVGGTIYLNSDTALSNLTFERGSGFTGTLLNVSNAELTLTGVTLDGKSLNASGQLVSLSRATLNIAEGTTLKNNQATAINAFQESSINMTGGSIESNTGTNGGGIYAYGATLNLTGGTIANNSADVGGGLCVLGGCTVTLDGTQITGNTSQARGGGVYVEGMDNGPSVFTMKSGTISGNAYAGEGFDGAGICAWGSGYETTIDIQGGSITGNTGADGEYSTGTAISLNGSGSYPSLKLSGSPTIQGDVFLWDEETKGPVIQVTGSFTPANPVSVQANYSIEGTTAVTYAAGLEPDLSQFASVVARMGLAQDGQDLKWVELYRVVFKTSNNQTTYKTIYVQPNGKIPADAAPAPTLEGYTLAGWIPYGGSTLWDFETNTVGKSPMSLLAAWQLNPPTVALSADKAAVHVGESITLTATPDHPIKNAVYSYAWYKDGELLEGETASTLTVTESGSYTVKVAATVGSQTSTVESEAVACTVEAHTSGGDWQYDENNHWHTCSVCGKPIDQAAHESDGGVITTEPTETEAGMMTYSCKVCGKVLKTETIPAHGHSYDEKWSMDASGHWHACTVCGDKTDFAGHTWSAWTTVKSPTETEAGSRERTCSICGYKQTEKLAATGTTPQTSDPHQTALFVGLMLASAAGLAIVIVMKKRDHSFGKR